MVAGGSDRNVYWSRAVCPLTSVFVQRSLRVS